ncbi:MAG: DNA repair protein RecO [Spirochaetes bacterium]|nr:DNA repair protein RecO [Spirochaetota bacterium]
MKQTVKTPGVVLEAGPYRSSGVLAVIYTEELGAVSVISSNARKPSSPAGAMLNRIAIIEMVLHGSGDLFTLKNASLVRDFPSIHSSAHKALAAAYLFDLIKHASPRGDSDSRMFAFLTAGLEAMNTAADRFRDIVTLTRAYEIKMLYVCGILPVFERCVSCGCAYHGGFYVSLRGGYVCTRCAQPNERILRLPAELMQALVRLVHEPLAASIKNPLTQIMADRMKLIIQPTLFQFFGKRPASAAVLETGERDLPRDD